MDEFVEDLFLSNLDDPLSAFESINGDREDMTSFGNFADADGSMDIFVDFSRDVAEDFSDIRSKFASSSASSSPPSSGPAVESTSNSIGAGPKKKKEMTAEEKLEHKAQLVREASRRYRERKKARAEKVKSLGASTASQLAPSSLTLLDILSVTSTPSASLSIRGFQSKLDESLSSLSRRLSQIMSRVQSLVRQGEAMDESEAATVFEAAVLEYHRIDMAGFCVWQLLISPRFLTGVVSRATSAEDFTLQRDVDSSLQSFVGQAFRMMEAKQLSLDRSQRSRIERALQNYTETIDRVISERKKIFDSLRAVLNASVANEEELQARSVEMRAEIDLLRQNLAADSEMYCSTMAVIMENFSIRARLLLISELNIKSASMHTLKTLIQKIK